MKVVFLIIISFLLTANSYAEDIDICTSDWPPYIIFEKDKGFSGFDVEIISTVMAQMGHNVVFHNIPWSRCQAYVEEGEMDGLTSLYLTPERQKRFYYPDEHLNVDQNVLLVNAANVLAFNGDIQTLTGKMIVVARDYSYGADFDQADYIEKFSVNEDKDILRVVAGRLGTIGIVSKYPAMYLAEKMGIAGDVKLIEPPVSEDRLFVAFTRAKGEGVQQRIVRKFSVTLQNFKRSDEYRRLVNSYLTDKITAE